MKLKNKWYEDINGNTSSKRIIIATAFGVIICLVIGVVLYGLNHSIASPDVVKDLLITGLVTPFVGMVYTVFEKKRGKENDHLD